jgi:hypothetical protein
MTTTDELEHLLPSMWSTLSAACLPSSLWCAAQTNSAEVRSCEPRGSRAVALTFLVRRSPVQLWARACVLKRALQARVPPLPHAPTQPVS